MTRRQQRPSAPGRHGADPFAQRMQLAVVALQSGAAMQAEEHLRAALKLVPSHPVANHFLGLCLHQRGQTAAGIAAIERAIATAPDYADAVNNLGNIFVQTNDLARAEQLLRRAIELAPTSAAAHNNLGIVLKSTQRDSESIGWFQKACDLDAGDPQLRRNLGDALRRTGDAKGAVQAYRSALALANDYDADTYRHLASCYRLLGDSAKAVQTARTWLEQDPENALARHVLASLGGEVAPPRADDAYVRTLFDNFAEEFDARLTSLGYSAPELLMREVRELGIPRFERVLDGGCGTGVFGPMLRPMSDVLEGVDLSPKMLDKARARGCYDTLHEAELTAFVDAHEDRWDLLVCADTFCYFGALEEVVSAMAKSMRSAGRLLFTVEELVGSDESFRLNPHGRYSHHEAYVRRTLDETGFVTSRVTHAALRQEQGQDVPALFVVAAKP